MKVKNVSKKVVAILAIIAVVLSAPIINLAHGGRTDSSGGHKDNKNKSGLGSYHYHCGGYPAHLHDGGVCPYAAPATPAATSTTSTPKTTSTTTSTSTKSTTPLTVKVTGVEIDEEEVQILVGETKALTATISPSNATDKTITWKSDNKEIVMVDSEGAIVAFKVGEATITATTSNGKKATVKVTVKPIAVSEIKLDKQEVTLNVEEKVTLLAEVLPEEATDKTVEWSSENTEIATVEEGVITAIASGTTKIICTSKDGVKSEVNVVVEEEEIEEVVAPVIEDDNLNNNLEKEIVAKNNEEKEETTELTPLNALGGVIALAGFMGLPVFGIKNRNKEEKFNFKKFIGNVFSYLLSMFTFVFSIIATSIVGLIITIATALSIAPPICKLINEKIDGKYTVKIRIITYIIGFILIIVML